jgi:hypothetical protein
MDNAADVLVAGFAMMTKWFSSTRLLKTAPLA